MKKCYVTQFETLKGLQLNGLWFGPEKPTRVYIWLHGLTSSCFSKHEIAEKITDSKTAVFLFNNRGAFTVKRFSFVKGKKKKGVTLGAAHEKFTDCIDDIDGAIAFAKSQGAKEIVLIGHSTGCQKAAYWASKKKDPRVKGIVLLAPVSDYAGMLKKYGEKKSDSYVTIAQKNIKEGKGSELMYLKDWTDETDDAYRFVSLYTPNSIEQQIFPYFDAKNRARFFASIKIPVLALMGEKEEYADRPVADILKWFSSHASSKCTVAAIPDANHSLNGAESIVAKMICGFVV